MLNIFDNDAFSVVRLTAAINNLKFAPGRIEQLGLFNEEPIDTTTVAMDLVDDVFRVIAPSPRGGPGETLAPDVSSMLALRVPHFEINDSVIADSVQNRRAWGTENQLETVFGKVNRRQAQHGISMGVTQELSRIGAIKGVVTYANMPDGTVVPPLNLFTTFNVTQPIEVNFALATAANGDLLAMTQSVVRTISTNLGGLPFDHIHAFCGDAFFDALIKNVEVRSSFLNTPMAEILRRGYALSNGAKIWGAFEFGNIVWENYRGNSDLAAYINTDKCHMFPLGVPGLFKSYYAPADYEETVNTMGQRLYTKQWAFPNGKGRHLDTQMNDLELCTRPKCLVQGKRA